MPYDPDCGGWLILAWRRRRPGLLIAGLGTGSRGSNSHPACSFCSTAWNTGVSVGWEGKSRY